jgi:hypothetical protein
MEPSIEAQKRLRYPNGQVAIGAREPESENWRAHYTTLHHGYALARRLMERNTSQKPQALLWGLLGSLINTERREKREMRRVNIR